MTKTQRLTCECTSCMEWDPDNPGWKSFFEWKLKQESQTCDPSAGIPSTRTAAQNNSGGTPEQRSVPTWLRRLTAAATASKK